MAFVYEKVYKLDNETLKNTYLEIKNISNADVPRNVRQSKLMADLFKFKKTRAYNWADHLVHVRRALEIEILNRVSEILK